MQRSVTRRRRHRRLPGLAAILVGCLYLLAPAVCAQAAAYRDELTFLGRTQFLFRDYALVVPLDLKRQPLPGSAFLEIKAWGAWNGKWVPYIYEPITVPGARPEDVNDIVARYRRMRPEAGLELRKGRDNGFRLHYDKGRTRFDLTTRGFEPRVAVRTPEGRLVLGTTDGTLDVNGHVVTGRVAAVRVEPDATADAAGRYGLYDHLTLLLPSGAILVVYHSRHRPGFNLAALLTPDGSEDRMGRRVQVGWQKLWSDSESGRDVPAAWTIHAPELDVRAELEEWGRNFVRYQTDAGKTAVVSNAMVRGWVEIAGVRTEVFGLNVHVQDE